MTSVRLVNDTDMPFIKEWLAKDEIHQSLGIQIEQFAEPETKLFIVEDEKGPVMAVRLHLALRAAVQFNPDTPLRSARAAKWVREWFKDVAEHIKAKEVIIRPGGKAKKFTERLGFKEFIGKFLEL